MSQDFQSLIGEIRACTLCKADMSRAPNPILQVSQTAKILIVGQAPGNLADLSGKPFTDPSGDRLRDWMQVSEEEFYDASKIAIVPMGLCFPGNDDKGGDLPPLKRCSQTWRETLMTQLSAVELTLLVGRYAQKWHLKERAGKTLTQRVEAWQELTSEGMFTTPHPSWRNTGWLKRNTWFEEDLLPVLRANIRALLSSP